jgi:hypothetical protein
LQKHVIAIAINRSSLKGLEKPSHNVLSFLFGTRRRDCTLFNLFYENVEISLSLPHKGGKVAKILFKCSTPIWRRFFSCDGLFELEFPLPILRSLQAIGADAVSSQVLPLF